MMEIGAEKRFRCSACQRTFTRNDHLKRHQLLHTGLKPYQCQFCNSAFSRSDGLRDHYLDCPLRGRREIPATSSGGRRRHACALCISMKLRCDGAGPCASCQRRKTECSNPSNNTSPAPREDKTQTFIPAESPFDRGSIQFLLNGGNEGWISRFQFPPTNERVAIQNKENNAGKEPLAQDAYQSYTQNLSTDFMNETFTALFSAPFGFMENADFASTPQHMPASDASASEPVQLWAAALLQGISSHVPKNSPYREDLLGNLQFLLTPSRIRNSVKLYFDTWHPNSRTIHPKLFALEHSRPALVAALAFMGALYSPDQLVVYAARALLDYVELFCYGSDTYSPEAEISNVFAGTTGTLSSEKERGALEDLQAGYLVAVFQHWAGNTVARKRAMEMRFSQIVKVARRLNLTRCRQLPEDRASEELWLYKESQIRTMAYIILVDCAFSFFSNYPCRLIPAELECDLPCEDGFFDSHHPYSEPGFTFSRQTTVNSAFERLFTCDDGPGPALALGLTIMDMFILIHVLYAYINAQMTLLTPLRRLRNSSELDKDVGIKAIKTALTTWRDVFVSIRSQIDDHTWANMGFWKNGYSYWSVAQLLMSKKEKVDSIMRMDYSEDKLAKLRLLFQDEGD